MSWLACERCGDLINSDNDPDCFLFGEHAMIPGPEKRKWDAMLCESCREELEEEDGLEPA